jgi:hypothetical protein
MLACSSCDGGGGERFESLVGAEKLPPAKVLSRELIQINRGVGEGSIGLLVYELRPDGTLEVSRLDASREKVLGSETFRLSPEVANSARKKLLRVRPTKLEGVEWETLPTGCKRQHCHDWGELAVAFIDQGDRPGVADAKVWMFTLPHAESCNNSQARKARHLISQIMKSLPDSKVAADFDRAEAAAFKRFE